MSRPRRSGFSLAEAMLALLILAVAYIPLSELYRMTTAQTIKSRNVLLARQLAQNLFEVYRMRSNLLLNTIAPSNLETPDLLADAEWRERLTGKAPEIEDVLKFAGFKMAVKVTLPDKDVFGLDFVDVTISWKEGGHDRSRRFARLLSR